MRENAKVPSTETPTTASWSIRCRQYRDHGDLWRHRVAPRVPRSLLSHNVDIRGAHPARDRALTIRSRRSIETSVITSLVAMLWFVGAAVLPATLLIFPSTHVFTQLASGLTRWDQLLTTPLPAPSSGSWLVLPVVTIWVGSAIASEIALRTRRALLAVMPLMTSYGIAIPFGIGAQASQLPSAACFLLGAGTLAIVVSPRYSKGTGVGQTTPTSIGKVFIPPFVAVGLVAGSLVIAPLLPGVHGANPYDPRAGRVPPRSRLSPSTPRGAVELGNQSKPGAVQSYEHSSGTPRTRHP